MKKRSAGRLRSSRFLLRESPSNSRQPQTRVRSLIMKSMLSQTIQSCGCFKRRTVISSLALTVTATILIPFRKLLAQTPTPQEKESTETKVMGMGSHLLQGKHPIDQIDAYVCGLHFYNGDMGRQVIAHHFCSHRSEEFLQCVIYDTNKSDARLSVN